MLFKRLLTLMATLFMGVAIFAQNAPESSCNKNVNSINKFVSFAEDKQVIGGHPRLFLSDADFASLRSLTQGNGQKASEIRTIHGVKASEIRAIHGLIMSRAEAILTENSPLSRSFDEGGKRMLGTSREALERILFCSYAYRFSDDKRFLDHTTFDLLSVCHFSSWNAENHFLDAAELALAVGIGYDWLYDDLSDSDRSTIISALMLNAFEPSADEDTAWFYYAEGNWNQVCNAGLLTAALAVYGDEVGLGNETDGVRTGIDAEKSSLESGTKEVGLGCDVAGAVQRIITDAIWSNRRAMETIYSPEGCYAEGPNYWSYGNMFQAVLLSAFESVTGSDQGLSSVEGFDKTATYKQLTYRHKQLTNESLQSTSLPYGNIFNYSDNVDELKPAYPLWYFAWKSGNWSLLDSELPLLETGKYSESSEFRLLPLLMMYALKMPEEIGGGANASIDAGGAGGSASLNGAASSNSGDTDISSHSSNLRSYFNPGVPGKLDDLPLMIFKGEDIYLGIKGGSPTTNHAHMDGGSFVFDAYGKAWAIDPSRASYAEMEQECAARGGDFWDMSQESLRWQMPAMGNQWHNTITVNGKDFNVKGKAEIIDTLSSGAVLDLSSLYEGELSSARRTIYIDSDSCLRVEDGITADQGKDAEIRWSFVTPAKVTVGRREIRLENEGTMIIIKTTARLASSRRTVPVEYEQFPSGSEDYRICGFTARVPKGKCVVFYSRIGTKNFARR